MTVAQPPTRSAGIGFVVADTRPRALVAALFVVLALGVGLRTVQYLAGVELWHDEAAVARNVADRGVAELVGRPLDHHQVAPAGFLALLAASTALFGGGEIGFRFAPWLLGLASLALFWRVARRFATGWPLLAGLAVFGTSPALVWYASSVKPYGGDVAISSASWRAASAEARSWRKSTVYLTPPANARTSARPSAAAVRRCRRSTRTAR